MPSFVHILFLPSLAINRDNEGALSRPHTKGVLGLFLMPIRAILDGQDRLIL